MAEETQKKNGADYGEQNIITLEWYEHIRRRSGMYIGRLGTSTSGDVPACTSAAWATVSGRETASTSS